MLFNSFEFLIFLPIVFLLYWFVFQKNLRLQNFFIVVVSYLFYGWWDWHFLLLMAFTTFCSYISGLGISYYYVQGRKKISKLLCGSNIVLNLLILGVYKYYNFFVDSFIELFQLIGINLHPVTLNLILPVGISFYTFQALSYTIDVYRGKIKATNDIISFFAFISFFPQLVAGPIERATNLLPQFQKKRIFDYTIAVDGTKQILWGLFKKMVIADNCADVVDKVWGGGDYSSLMLILTAVLFAFQIYGDFSGYSDIAIGTGKLFGIKLMRNFNVPYFSRDIAEFWKRWHISLNTWFVDYVYIPMGGSREGKWKTFRNTFVVFLVSGLWHGANWTYVLWGVFHALLFLPLLLLGKNKRYRDTVAAGKLLPSVSDAWHMLSTFVLVVFGWIIFRAENMREAIDYCYSIVTNWSVSSDIMGIKAVVFICFMLIIEWLHREKEHPFQISIPSRVLRWSFYLFIALLCLTQAGKQVQFIYFQF